MLVSHYLETNAIQERNSIMSSSIFSCNPVNIQLKSVAMLGDIVVLLGVAAATDPAPGLGVGAGVLHVAAAPGAEALGLELAGAHLHR